MFKVNIVLLFILFNFKIMADMRVGNQTRSYAESYKQVLNLQHNSNTLPIVVENKEIQQKILSNNSNELNLYMLEACKNIYIDGVFIWGMSDSGIKKNNKDDCVAIVEMRAVNGNNDILLATAKLSAGDSLKCNISDFPTNSYTKDVERITFPSDNEPTLEDVEKVMNDEQKQNGTFKIVAGTIVGALGGNVLSNNNNKNGLINFNSKEKILGTIIGGVGGAGIMAGNSYAGKVTGDTILGTSINSVAGGVLGNMVAEGEEILRIEDCDYNNNKTKCLLGMVYEYGDNVINAENNKKYDYYINLDNKIIKKINLEKNNAENDKECVLELEHYLINVKVNEVLVDDYKSTNNNVKRYIIDSNNCFQESNSGDWVKITSANRIEKKIPAMIPNIKDKFFGIDISDWNKLKNKENFIIVSRDGTSLETKDNQLYDINNFYPLTIKSDMGEIVDINNKARLKSTLKGAGVGAGLGALSSYQKAKSDIENRYVESVRAYTDSLNTIYCATGKRYLGKYNDTIIIPNLSNDKKY